MPEPTLRDIQTLFWKAIAYPTGVSDFLEQCTAEEKELFSEVFAETDRFKRAERVQVYAEAYFFRLHDALAEEFPGVQWLLGTDSFHNLVTDYVLQHPSTSPSLHDYGRDLSEFLSSHELGLQYPHAVAAAALERAMSEVLHADDGKPLEHKELVAFSPAQWSALRLQTLPGSRIVSSDWDLKSLHKRRLKDEPRPTGSPPRCPAAYVIWRKGHRPFFRPIQSPERDLLKRLIEEGATFPQLCEVAQNDKLGPGEVAQMLQRWVADQLVEQASLS